MPGADGGGPDGGTDTARSGGQSPAERAAAAAGSPGGGTPGLRERLRVRPAGPAGFRGEVPVDVDGGRVFGGLILGQALTAAAADVPPGFAPQHLDMHFLAPARQGESLDHTVQQLKTGRSTAVRRVDVSSGGAMVATAVATFGPEADDGLDLSPVFDPPPRPGADGHVRSGFHADPAALGWEFRELAAAPVTDGAIVGPGRRFWARTIEADDAPPVPGGDDAGTPDDLTEYGLALYLSDFATVWAVGRTVDRKLGFIATVNHSIWFHRRPDCAEWLYGELSPASVTGWQGLVTGGLYRADGVVLATVAQQVVARPRREA